MNKQKIFDKCIKVWGEQKNKDQLIEEAGELIVAIRHYARNKITKEQLIEEMVDVQMMIDICKDIYDVNKKEWDKMMAHKLDVVNVDLEIEDEVINGNDE